MMQQNLVPADIRVLSEQIYQYKKGVRRMSLYTFPACYEQMAVSKLERQGIPYVVQQVGNKCVNLYFGRPECIAVVKDIVRKPLNQLSPEEDFMLGTLLGYDICEQCQRYCKRKQGTNHLAV